MPAGIQPVTGEVIDYLGGRIRPEHLREINSLLPMDGGQALRYGIEAASVAYAAVRNGTPLFVVGVGDVSPMTGAGLGWLLGTSDMIDHGVWVADVSRAMLPILHRHSGAARIQNWIPAEYRVARKWLAWLGFSIGAPQPVFNDVPHVHVYHDREATA